MAQQINLLTPILLAPKRYFSALTLLQATGLLLLAGAAATVWLQRQDRAAEVEHQQQIGQFATERQQLIVALAKLPAPLDANTLQQQVQSLEMGNAQRQALLTSLGGEAARRPGRRHSDLLAHVARTLPDAAWLTEMRYAPGRLELVGGTLATGALRPWLTQLNAHPLLSGEELSALRVDRLGATSTPSAEPGANALLDRAGALAHAGVPVWTFRVVSAPAAPAVSASGAAR